jgi:hypothetical protein
MGFFHSADGYLVNSSQPYQYQGKSYSYLHAFQYAFNPHIASIISSLSFHAPLIFLMSDAFLIRIYLRSVSISILSPSLKCSFSRIDFGISTIPSFPMTVDADMIKVYGLHLYKSVMGVILLLEECFSIVLGE